jgi:hypothetical protein
MEAAPKKKKINSKSKGSGFENAVAKKFSAALAPLKFIRTQGSGARVGGKNFDTLGQMFGEEALKLFVGDVVPVNEKEAGVTWLHSLECKFYKTQDPFTSLVSGTANIYKWMEESVTDAVKINKTPLIVFKWNNTPIFVGIRTSDLSDINLERELRKENAVVPKFTVSNEKGSIAIFYLDDLITVSSFWVANKV